MIRLLPLMSFLFFLSGCLTPQQEQTIKDYRIENSQISINYYSDKSVTSLEIPPDLTSPQYENSFRVREFGKDISMNTVNLTNTDEIIENEQKVFDVPSNISIKTSGTRKWLEVDKNSELLWNLSKQFLRENGFVINKSDKKIGIMETNYLENKKPEIPASSMGWIRSMLASEIDNVTYTLPSVDSYTIRIEPINENKSEVHLSLSSMAEVITGFGKDETTLWQHKERDVALETEMLFKLMLYFGSDSAVAREKIINAQKESKLVIKKDKDINGYTKLIFNFGIEDTWDNVSWALNNMNLDIQDKDIKEKSFYINIARTSDKGFFTKIFGDEAVKKVFRLSLKLNSNKETELIFYDVSEKNEEETKEFSNDLMQEITEQFTKT